jgi:hypothetical protein
MTESSVSRARLRKITLIVLFVTIAAFVTALILRDLDSGSFPLLKITYEMLGAIAGLGTAFVVVWVPMFAWQERRKARRTSDRSQ